MPYPEPVIIPPPLVPITPPPIIPPVKFISSEKKKRKRQWSVKGAFQWEEFWAVPTPIGKFGAIQPSVPKFETPKYIIRSPVVKLPSGIKVKSFSEEV